jgi:hypothetical protein
VHPSPPASERAASRPFEPLLALGLPALLFLSAIGRAGLWDPYELNIADLGRRAAIHVFGAQNLALAGAENRIPTLGDLGRNELPITSMALSFRLFGLSEWAGRLPLALWGLGGIVALWAWLRRMVSPRAATYGTLLLATTPLYFVHARTMLGDIVTMASCLMAFAGLSVSLLDPEPRGASDLRWLGLGLLGLVGGFLSRGSLIGVAVPALAVGLTWCLSVLGSTAEDRPEVTPVRGAGVAALLVAGLMGGYLALSGASHATPLNYSPWLGSAIVLGQKFPTFDAVALQLGHTLFPWSAFLPLAIGRLLAPPPGIAGPSLAREQRLRMLLIVGAGLSYAALGWVAPRTGMQPFAGVGLVAAMGALVLLDFERGAHASRALAVASSLLAVLFYTDFSRMPEKAMSVFGVTTASFPESFREPGGHLLLGATALFIALLLLSLVDGHDAYPDQASKPAWARLTAAEETWAILNELNEVWAGNLSFLAVMLEAMLAGIGALIFVSDRLQWRLTFTGTLSAGLKTALVNAWWAVPVALGAGLFALLTLRHLFRLALGRTRSERAWVAAAAGVLAGLVLSLGYYPALASQLSPKEVFESYRKLHAGDEPLGLLGVAGRSAAYYALRGAGQAQRPLPLPDARGTEHDARSQPAGARRPVEPDRPREQRARRGRGEPEPLWTAGLPRRSSPAPSPHGQPERRADGPRLGGLRRRGHAPGRRGRPGQDLPTAPVFQGARDPVEQLEGLHPHRRLRAPLQRRSRALRRQVPDEPLAARRHHHRPLRVQARAQLHPRQLHPLLRILRR